MFAIALGAITMASLFIMGYVIIIADELREIKKELRKK